MSLVTSISDPPIVDITRIWAEAASIAEQGLDWPRQLRTLIAQHGEHPRRRAGAGADFWQYRPLAPGEPVARVDWRKSARSDALLVRDHEQEAPARLHIWCDQSPSMHYRSQPGIRTKAEWACLLAASVALAAANAGEQVTALGEKPGLRHLRERLPYMLAPPPPAVLPASSLVFVISDCLSLEDWLAQAADFAVKAGSRLVVVHVHDPAEADFPFTGRIDFVGLEGEAAREVDDAEAARAAYLDAWRDFQQTLKKSVEHSENMYSSVSTTTAVADCFARLVQQLGAR